tara:strand:- start:151 stop:897 length:747 start_codon:yes stop_codon:yes gene_type:complete
LASNSTKNLVKDVIIIVIALAVIWIGLQVIFGTANPFYVVSSGSMIPTLEVYDIIIVEGNTPFQHIQKGDIIVFYAPAAYEKHLKGEKGGEERVIVHRVDTIVSENPKTIQTKGDANPRSMKNVDYPITEKNYLGKVEHVVPQIGYITQILQPPINYIIIAVIIGVMVIKQLSKKKKKPEFQNTEESTKTDQTKSGTIDDRKFDSKYRNETDTEYTTTPEPELTPRHVNESESLDDPSKNIKDDSEEK